jgi:hypothetical protein
MSYPRGIDDYEDEDLVEEIAERIRRRERGKCDYCQRPQDEKAWCGSGRHTRTAGDLRYLLAEIPPSKERG